MENRLSHAPASGLNRPLNIDLRNRTTVLILAWLIFLAALGLRVTGIGEYPQPHKTDDEFGFLWGGLNFWDSGMTESWSAIRSDTHVGQVTFHGRNYHMVRPYLDHPPLFTLIVGGLAKFTDPARITTTVGDNTITTWDVDLSRARWVMVPIFIATFWLLFSTASLAFSPGIALLTVVLYGFMSHAAAHGRLILADNLAAMLILLGAWGIQRWLAGRGSRLQMVTIVIIAAAAATLTKIPAWCIVPALATMLIMADRRREVLFVFAGFGVGLVLYAAWIAYCGFPEFLSVMTAQSGRFRGFNAFQRWSGLPNLLDVADLNGIVIAGWFCMIALALTPRAHPLSVIGPVFVLSFTFFAGDVIFGWYTAPLYPWFALAIAVMTARTWDQPRSPMMFAWLLLFLPHAFQTVYIAHYELETALRYIYVLPVVGIIAAMLWDTPRARSILQISMIAILALILMREVYEITNQRTDRISDAEKYFPRLVDKPAEPNIAG